ncbi:hypothetical protein TKK_0017716 [Trichogramma kaykai]|uniref:MoaB/Mog domain-containing protein n=1 Tax=Trichogramma kaykai TaxID=54128 RepID=A0ABD2W140_9HYME
MSLITYGILTVSDSCYAKENVDKSGPLLKKLISTTKNLEDYESRIECCNVVPDEISAIEAILIEWSDKRGINVIFTTGGTGFSPRDVTPEATKNVIQRETPGFTHAMFTKSYEATPLACLSRAASGIRGKTLIINFPGSPKAVEECYHAVQRAIPHAVDLLCDQLQFIKDTHAKILKQEKLCGCSHKKGNVSLNLNNVAGRLRESPYPMITIEESQDILLKTCDNDLPFVKINIWECLGRVLAETVHSPCNLPPFRASIKDGYAVIASDGKGKRLVLSGIEAGHEPEKIKIKPGTCVRINTGAPVPHDADAVVQVEDTILSQATPDGNEELEIEILTEPVVGQDIRPIGLDISKGDAVLEAGTKIGAVEMGILAACGVSQVAVTPMPKIGVLSTGNELQKAGEPAIPGHVYDSNKITLMMMLKENGYEALDLGIAKDEENDMFLALEGALGNADVIVTTGSVSMGDRDMLKPMLEKRFNAKIHFGRVNLKPGKPTTYATCHYLGRKKYFLCLPGNPVSAMVTAHLYVIPLLNHLTGNKEKPVEVQAKLTSRYLLDPRPEFARVNLVWTDEDPRPNAYSTGNQISSKLLSCRRANALLKLPPRTEEKRELKKGDVVPAILLGFK